MAIVEEVNMKARTSWRDTILMVAGRIKSENGHNIQNKAILDWCSTVLLKVGLMGWDWKVIFGAPCGVHLFLGEPSLWKGPFPWGLNRKILSNRQPNKWFFCLEFCNWGFWSCLIVNMTRSLWLHLKTYAGVCYIGRRHQVAVSPPTHHLPACRVRNRGTTSVGLLKALWV